jgi:Galactose oxidase, central domain
MEKLLWTQKQDIGPPARLGHALVFDQQAQLAVLFGGDSLQGHYFGDTWGWDGQDWTQLADLGPAPRAGHAVAYDALRNRTVLFGGATSEGAQGDTWEWDGDAWTQVADVGPAPRAGHAMTFDAARGTVILFGGASAAASPFGDTWAWDGNDWVQQEDVGPSPRMRHALTFDTTRSRTVLYGGIAADSSAMHDTWEWDGTRWTEEVNFGPPACFGAAMVFKVARSCLFGGISAVSGGQQSPILYGVSWEWDGKRWTARQDIGPGPREGHAMVFDSVRARVVLFGGSATALDDSNVPAKALGDTWEHPDAGVPAPAAEVAISSLTVMPNPATLGTNLVFTVTLQGAAPAAGQSVAVVDNTGNAIVTVTVLAGQLNGSATLALPNALPSNVTLPLTIPLSASAGGATQSTTLTITA